MLMLTEPPAQGYGDLKSPGDGGQEGLKKNAIYIYKSRIFDYGRLKNR